VRTSLLPVGASLVILDHVPRRDERPVDLTGIVLPDSRTGEPVDLGALVGTYVLTAIRHRF